MSLVPGFPNSTGNKKTSCITKAGPASYSAISIAAPPTGGQDVTAAELGLKYIEFLFASCSDSGAHEVKCIPCTAGLKSTTWKLMWCLAISGQEASGDLSARTVRLFAVGM